MNDPYNNDLYKLQRFIDAQDPLYAQVRAELRRGQKLTHWMWFVFPQIAGLGHSAMARRYAIATRAEAQAYLQHSILGARLRECTRLVNDIENKSIEQIFGRPDNLKFHSSMTLFAQVATDHELFNAALAKYFAGQLDAMTLARL
jgi:uncharacterized protein (DUF1810 family)